MQQYHKEVRFILAVYIILALAYSIIIPPFEGFDEPGHFEVIRYIAENTRLPIIGQAGEIYQYRQEAAQPPLYYVLSAGLVRVMGLHADTIASHTQIKPRVVCGPETHNLYANRAVFYHNPHEQAFPGQSAVLMLYCLRAWSITLQAITVYFTYALLRRLSPHQITIARLGTAIVAFNPQFLFVSGAVNNDNLVTPLTTIGLYLILQIWLEGFSIRRSLAIGMIGGLAGLTKLSGWLILPLAVGAMTAQRLRSQPTRETALRWFGNCALLAFSAIAISGWWFWRNWTLYGDLTALEPMLDIVGRRTIPIIPLEESYRMFLSFWGQVPCAYYPSVFYLPFALLSIAGIIGLGWAWRQAPTLKRWVLLTLLGWFLLVLVSWIRWDIMTYAMGGRLLFPALPAIGGLLAIGLYQLPHRRSVISLTAIILVFMAWWTVANILPAFFAPPAIRRPDTVHPNQSIHAAFGEQIRLLGYDLKANPDTQQLDIRLYWLTTIALEPDYSLALQLVSSAPEENTLRWTYDSWPGRGNYPTSAWQPGRAIVDHYRFDIPEANFLTQAWDLQLTWYNEQTLERLPVITNGTVEMHHLTLAQLRWPGKSPTCPGDSRLTGDVRFGDALALTHAWIVPGVADTQVFLCWKALNPPPTNYHVFVHLYDDAGNLRQTGDGPPMNGAFPTSLWQPGDAILDIHDLSGVQPQAGNTIAVGWYQLEDGSRLSTTYEHQPIQGNSIEIWPARP